MKPTIFNQNAIEQDIPKSMLINSGILLDGAQFVQAMHKINDNDILLKREMGYSGGPLKGITTRQIPEGPRLYKKNAPGVVFISDLATENLGSGIILDNDGHIITNWHVVNGSEKMLVWFYDKKITEFENLKGNNTVANVVGVDISRDLALLKLQSSRGDLSHIEIGNENQLSVAQYVFAIGHPENKIWTFSQGVIGQIHSKYDWASKRYNNHIADVIQTQTPINPGNSGGPLFDEKGKLIGINTFRLRDSQGLNFAISISEVKSFYKSVLDGDYKPDFMSYDDTKYSDWESYDLNENGIPDSYLFKNDNLQYVIIDENEDQINDYVLINIDDDPTKWDAKIYDRDKDGFFEYWLMDTDQNGELDNALLDTDKDGVPDYYL